jgi:hypothetical protein
MDGEGETLSDKKARGKPMSDEKGAETPRRGRETCLLEKGRKATLLKGR